MSNITIIWFLYEFNSIHMSFIHLKGFITLIDGYVFNSQFCVGTERPQAQRKHISDVHLQEYSI